MTHGLAAPASTSSRLLSTLSMQVTSLHLRSLACFPPACRVHRPPTQSRFVWRAFSVFCQQAVSLCVACTVVAAVGIVRWLPKLDADAVLLPSTPLCNMRQPAPNA